MLPNLCSTLIFWLQGFLLWSVVSSGMADFDSGYCRFVATQAAHRQRLLAAAGSAWPAFSWQLH